MKMKYEFNGKIVSGIYGIYCEEENKWYVGASSNIEQRWRLHKGCLKNNSHCNIDLQKAFNNYNKVFYIILEKCAGDLDAREYHWMKTLGDLANLYNRQYPGKYLNKGQTSIAAKLTNRTVEYLRNEYSLLYEQREITLKDIIKLEGLSIDTSTLDSVLKGETYKEIEGTLAHKAGVRKGEKCASAKLTNRTVKYLRNAYSTLFEQQEITLKDIIKLEGLSICVSTLKNVLKGESYKNVEGTLANKAGARKGEKSNLAKLTDKDVLDIRQKYQTGNYTMLALGNIYNISQANISYIINGHRWAHIGGPIKGKDY